MIAHREARQEITRQRRLIGPARDARVGEDRLDLRRKYQKAWRRVVVQRPHADSVASEQQPARVRIGDRERKIAVQPLDAPVSVRPICRKHDDRIRRIGGKVALASQRCEKLGTIVESSVERHHRAGVNQRLALARRFGCNAGPAARESDVVAHVRPAVAAPMRENRETLHQHGPVQRTAVPIPDPQNPAQAIISA
jgi:hypothetical protein